MKEINQKHGVEIVAKEKDAQGEFYTVVLLTTGQMNQNGRQYAGDLAHIARGVIRSRQVYSELDPYHDYRFTRKHNSLGSELHAQTSIDLKNVCASIEGLTLSSDKQSLCATIRPFGPNAKMVKELMAGPNENLTFAMRAVKNAEGKIDKIVTWDLLPE